MSDRSSESRRRSNSGDRGLYREAYEKDSCGFGLIASLDDAASHWLVRTAIAVAQSADASRRRRGRRQDRRWLRTAAEEADDVSCVPSRRKLGSRSHRISPRATCSSAVSTSRPRARAGARSPDPQGRTGRGGLAQLPIGASACGDEALKTLPRIEQLFVNSPPEASTRRHSIASSSWRAAAPRRRSKRDKVFYVPSLSASTIVFKGMVMPQHLTEFYPDLEGSAAREPRSRYFISVSRPTRCRSGDSHIRFGSSHITARSIRCEGNRNWALARGPLFRSPLLPD